MRNARLLATACAAAVGLTGCAAGSAAVVARDAGAPAPHVMAARPAPGAPGRPAPASPLGARRSLHGDVIGIDPGHNGHNYRDPSYLNHQVWNGREREACDTTGTATDSGYTEPRFTWRVAGFLRRDLRAAGARVVMTRHNNHGVGPCVNTRARIIDRAHAAVAIDIHGDGGPASGRGFAVLEPVRDRVNHRVVHSSARFGAVLRHHLLTETRLPTSTYDGVRGITHRNDLAGLNLTTVPKVLIECGNMRNATDARLMTSPHFQRRLARVFADAITAFLRQRSR